ncbi:MAG: hypothetical protein LBU38_00275 [Propionibacteriaceae bacterium]|jgi:hypothetical protein|nr:hypothetical protein [Propionibacteriaceae bacterium]
MPVATGETAVADDFEALRARVVGYQLPGGTFEVAEYERFLSHDAILSPRLPAGVLHPTWVLLGALRGMGMTMEEVAEIAGAGKDDVVMFGQSSIDQVIGLKTAVPYVVAGKIASLTRKEGKRGGIMHSYEVELTISTGDGQLCAVSSQTFLILKGAANGA